MFTQLENFESGYGSSHVNEGKKKKKKKELKKEAEKWTVGNYIRSCSASDK